MDDWKKLFHELFFYSTEKDAVSRAFDLKDKYIPSSLYRYRKLNEYTLNEIINGTIYIHDPKNFNDPYDSWIKLLLKRRISRNGSIELFRKALSSHYSKEILDEIFMFPDWFDRLYQLVFESTEFNVLDTIIDPMFEELNKQAIAVGRKMMKVCCFTEIKNNLAMWTHYSEEFTGICIEYDMSQIHPDDCRRRRIRMFPVFYDPELIDYTERFLSNPQLKGKDIFLESSLHKLTDWSYEKEWRLNIGNGIIEKDANYQFPVIKAIYMGYLVTEAYQEILLSIVKCKRYTLKKMKIMSYGLDFDVIYEPDIEPR